MPLVTDFTYQIGASGFILNDDVSDTFVDIVKVVGIDSAPTRTSVRNRDGRDGAYVDSGFEQSRTISLQGTLYDDAANVELTLDRFKSEWAPSLIPVPLYFRHPGIGGRMVWVYPQGCNYDIETIRRVGLANVTFNAVAGDPRIYAESETTRTIGVTNVIQTGMTFNFGFNLGFGGVTFAGYPPLVGNSGNRKTPVKFRLWGPFLNPHIHSYTSNKEMAFDILVDQSTDYLEIDTNARTVRLHSAAWGVRNARDTLRSPSWFDLEAGDNVIGFNVEGNASLATHLDIIYRSAWR